MVGTIKYAAPFLIIMIFLLGFYQKASSQSSTKFTSPLDIPLELSANFGEIRANHFHTGFDIRTNERTGYKVYASADGYISRIKISAGGYGKAIYITHPNGYMTVYAHLEKFAEEIASYVLNEQYSKQSFEVELFPSHEKFPVAQGDLIAYSGNSGSSGGPHLHFEIRDASGETYPLNPGLFFKLNDTITPRFFNLHLYSLDVLQVEHERFPIKNNGVNYLIKPDSIIVNSATSGIGIEAKDFMNNSGNDFGIYEFSLTTDDKLIYNIQFNRIDFVNGRYVNAFIDYSEKKRSGTVIQRLFRMPGDHNTIYHNLVNNGILQFSDTEYHKIDVAAKDVYGNVSHLNFYLKQKKIDLQNDVVVENTPFFHYDQQNNFNEDSIQLSFPANVFYENLNFQYSMESTYPNSRYSALHHVHNRFTPVHSYYTIRLLPRYIPASIKSKALIVYEDGNGEQIAKTTTWENEWLVTSAREFGDFYVMVDTSPPKIVPLRIVQNKLLTGNMLRFSISDNLSGIVNYSGYLDSKWFLMEYDPRNGQLSGMLPPDLPAGEHSLILIVNDDVKNGRTYTFNFKK